MSNGCAPVLASYSAITLFTSSMSAVAGSYSRSVVSPCDENVRILAFMFGLLRDVHCGLLWNSSERGQDPSAHIAPIFELVKTGSGFVLTNPALNMVWVTTLRAGPGFQGLYLHRFTS